MSRNEVVIPRQTADGFKVARASRDSIDGQPARFHVGVETYTSRRAWEVGAEWRSWDHDLSDFPELAPVAAVDGCEVETGEPMHGPSNGWYRLGGADMAREIDGIERYPHRKSYYDAPAHRFEYDHLSPDFAAYFVDMAARSMHLPVEVLPNVQDPALFAAWVDEVARPLWHAQAHQARECLDYLSRAYAAEVEQAREPEGGERSCSFSIGGLSDDEHAELARLEAALTASGGRGVEIADQIDALRARRDGRISVRADFDRAGVMPWSDEYRFIYRVQVRACGTSYSTRYGGSIADYEADRHDARGACNCVLRELIDALNYSDGREWAEEMGMEDAPARQVAALDRCVKAAERMRSALESCAEVIA
jgi:hypothetical protein